MRQDRCICVLQTRCTNVLVISPGVSQHQDPGSHLTLAIFGTLRKKKLVATYRINELTGVLCTADHRTNVGKPMINLPFGGGLYQPFMVILGMVVDGCGWFTIGFTAPNGI